MCVWGGGGEVCEGMKVCVYPTTNLVIVDVA